MKMKKLNVDEILSKESYENQLFKVQYLKAENYGFEFIEYKFPFERLEDE